MAERAGQQGVLIDNGERGRSRNVAGNIRCWVGGGGGQGSLGRGFSCWLSNAARETSFHCSGFGYPKTRGPSTEAYRISKVLLARNRDRRHDECAKLNCPNGIWQRRELLGILK